MQACQLLDRFQQTPQPLFRLAPGQEAFCVPSARAFLRAVLDSSLASLRTQGQQARQPRGAIDWQCTVLCPSGCDVHCKQQKV